MDNQAIITSKLYDETTFYRKFISDLQTCSNEVIVESPFITKDRLEILRPILEKLIKRNVEIYIMTRDPIEHEPPYDTQSEEGIRWFEHIGIQALICTGNHHRKLAIIDRKILWEGSLNILSQSKSREIMRRIDSTKIAQQMFDFLNLEKFL